MKEKRKRVIKLDGISYRGNQPICKYCECYMTLSNKEPKKRLDHITNEMIYLFKFTCKTYQDEHSYDIFDENKNWYQFKKMRNKTI